MQRLRSHIPLLIRVVRHPLRRSILIVLGRYGCLNGTEMAQQLRIKPSALRYHLAFMLERKVIRADRRTRPIRYGLGTGARVLFMRSTAVLAFNLPRGEQVVLKIPNAWESLKSLKGKGLHATRRIVTRKS